MVYIAFGAMCTTFIMNLRYVDALYFTTVSIETIGFGDIPPSTTGARVFICVYSAFGIVNLGMAVALIRGLSERGVSVPDDFAVIAYDNLEWSPLVEPPLTCVSPPRYDMGVAAGEMIVNLIEGNPVEATRVLPTQMVTRRSCGCAWSPLDERRGIET